MDLHALAKDCKKFLTSFNRVGIKKISATVHRGTIRIGLLMDPHGYSPVGRAALFTQYWSDIQLRWWEQHGKPPMEIIHLERDATGEIVVMRVKEI